MSIDFESTSTTWNGEKPYATFNCWMGTLVDNDGHVLVQKINTKLENAQQIFNVRPWIERLLGGRFRFAANIASGINSWTSITSEWNPYQRWQMNYCVEPRRWICRPANCSVFFSHEIFHSSWLQAAKNETWSSHEINFAQWCLERWCLVAIVSHVPRGPQLWLGRELCGRVSLTTLSPVGHSSLCSIICTASFPTSTGTVTVRFNKKNIPIRNHHHRRYQNLILLAHNFTARASLSLFAAAVPNFYVFFKPPRFHIYNLSSLFACELGTARWWKKIFRSSRPWVFEMLPHSRRSWQLFPWVSGRLQQSKLICYFSLWHRMCILHASPRADKLI